MQGIARSRCRYDTELLYLHQHHLGQYARMCVCCCPQVTFDQDVIISQMNEYEVLQLLMGECRESLAAYKTSLEEDVKLLQVMREAWDSSRDTQTAW